jgi:hypothetical protein
MVCNVAPNGGGRMAVTDVTLNMHPLAALMRGKNSLTIRIAPNKFTSNCFFIFSSSISKTPQPVPNIPKQILDGAFPKERDLQHLPALELV